MKRFSKSLLMIAAMFCLMGFASVQSAFADTVTYTTTGTFGAGGNTVTAGGVTLTFTGGTFMGNPTQGGQTFTFAQFGTFTVSGTGTGGALNTTFTLNVAQTNPAAGSGNIAGTVTGQLSIENSTVFINFNNPTPGTGLAAGPGRIVLGTHIYEVFNTSINNPNEATTLNGRISETNPIPEPATMILLGTGLAGIAAKVRRRRNNTEA